MAVERCELHHTVREEDGVVSAGSETLAEGLTWKSEGEGEENDKGAAGYVRCGCVGSGGVEYYAVNTVNVGTAGEKITTTI